VRADEKLTAFLELESAICGYRIRASAPVKQKSAVPRYQLVGCDLRVH